MTEKETTDSKGIPDSPARPEDSTNHPPAENELPASTDAVSPNEIGGRNGPEPTRYGDWEKNGRCIDF